MCLIWILGCPPLHLRIRLALAPHTHTYSPSLDLHPSSASSTSSAGASLPLWPPLAEPRSSVTSPPAPSIRSIRNVARRPSSPSPPSHRATDAWTANMIENQRRRLLRALNSRFIYGRIPLLHSLVFLVQMAAVSILTRRFNSYYAARPVLTTMITNAVLGGIADTVAQTLTSIRRKAVRKNENDWLSMEMHELDRRNPFHESDLVPDTRTLPPPFDFERLTRFMAYGFLMAPIQHKWFSFLSRCFPITKDAGTWPALKRVAFDQFLFAPVGLGIFFTFMTLAEGGGKNAVLRKFQDVYIPALKANFMVWPAVQMLNFRVMPLSLQIPFVSTVGIAWTAYLSLTNSSDES